MKTKIAFCFVFTLLSTFIIAQNSVSQYLEINQVRALYSNNNVMFWDQMGVAQYEVPKGTGKHALFSHSLWIRGIDNNGQPHLAAHFLLSYGQDFYPGPLYTQGVQAGTCDSLLSNQYNQIWSINSYEIQELRYRFENNLMSGYSIPSDILSWPVHGPADCDDYLAPYFDYDDDGFYNPYNGDYPLIKGDQMLYWIFNDNTQPHGETGGQPLGVEVRCMAYAFSCDSLILATNGITDYTTFLSYQIINRSTYTYQDAYIGLFTDGDLGDFEDDFIGFNLARNTYYFYNGDENDGNGNGRTYGENPPAVGIVLLNGPYKDADGTDNPTSYDSITGILNCDINSFNGNINGTNFGDGTIDNERLGFTNFMYINNPSYCTDESATCDPSTSEQFSNYLRGYWRDSLPLTYGEDGHSDTGITARFAYPDNSDTCFYGTDGVPVNNWSEVTAGNISCDRRGLGTIGPVTIETGEVINIDLAFVWSRDSIGGNVLAKLFNDIDIVRSLYNNGNLPECHYNIDVSVADNINTDRNIKIYPTIAPSWLYIEINNAISDNYHFTILDTRGLEIKKGVLTGKHSRIPMNDLASGVYFIRIRCPHDIATYRFIIN
ncbi:MAG: T9SS type A sorting domain-containing protein [Bacteroidetes bacterium]|nr:T9SS type A sorting domain-containing protein [Bacteroidota bacterium]